MRLFRQSGFTLLELCIAAIIISILVAIAVPIYKGATERAKCSQAIGILKNMAAAAIDYNRNNLTFSGMQVSDLETLVGANFYSIPDIKNSNPDWRFSITSATDTTFTIEALRTSSYPNNNQTIIINENGQLSGSYDRVDPTSGL